MLKPIKYKRFNIVVDVLEIQEFLDFIDERHEPLSMESLNLSWSNFL